MYKKQILSKISEYLKKKKYPHKRYGKLIIILCPFCESKSLTARIIPHTSKIKCLNPKCNKKFTLASIVRKHEKKFEKTSKEDIIYYLKDLLNINVLTKKDEEEIQEWFNFFEQNGFSLVPIVKNGKAPIEKNWTQKEHKVKEDWIRWVLVDGLNIGARTGVTSNLTVIDIDQKEIPEEIKELIGETLIQKTKKGIHLFYKYEQDLPKSRIDEFKIDIENEGGQVVIYPSIADDFKREFLNKNKITPMPTKLKELLKSKIRLPKRTFSEQITKDIETDGYRKPLIEEGDGRNDLFIRLAGKFRKFLNLNQTESIIRILNNVICSPPLVYREIKAMMSSLERYTIFDEEELAQEVLNYLKEAESAKRGEIAIALNEENKRVTKVLNYLVKEGYVIKRGNIYFIVKKVEWKTSLIDEGKPVKFKVPYFYDRAIFNDKDMILIGAKTKRGKTHMAINIVQQLTEQGITPHYLSLETGCFDEQTEILTDKGWKYFKDLNKTEKVITLNPETNEIEYQKPINYFEYNYYNTMLSIKTRYLDLLITPNHKQPMFIRNKDKIKLYSAQEMPNHNKIPKIGKWKGIKNDYFTLSGISYNKYLGKHKKYHKIIKPPIKINIKNWLKFLGLYLAEGSTEKYRISIAQQDKKKIKKVKKIIKSLPFKFNYYGHQFRILDSRLAYYCKQFGKSNQKFVPNYVKKLTPELIECFLEGYCLGDGYIRPSGQRNYFTSSKQLADDIQELILKIGYFANINIRKSKNTLAFKKYRRNYDLYWIAEVKNLKGVLPKNKKWITYKGKVYDVKVPKYHILYVRRNGKTAWSGNSRFAKIALQLGLKEGDFRHAFCADPTKIEIEKDTVTIIDWLLPDNYAEVDKIFKHFAEQLDKYRGFLIVFMQLKDTGDWFSPNLVRLFPALAVKYIYDDEKDGTYGRFDITEVREPLARGKQFTIPCKYDWESRKLIRIEDELNEENKEENKNEETKDSGN